MKSALPLPIKRGSVPRPDEGERGQELPYRTCAISHAANRFPFLKFLNELCPACWILQETAHTHFSRLGTALVPAESYRLREHGMLKHEPSARAFFRLEHEAHPSHSISALRPRRRFRTMKECYHPAKPSPKADAVGVMPQQLTSDRTLVRIHFPPLSSLPQEQNRN